MDEMKDINDKVLKILVSTFKMLHKTRQEAIEREEYVNTALVEKELLNVLISISNIDFNTYKELIEQLFERNCKL